MWTTEPKQRKISSANTNVNGNGGSTSGGSRSSVTSQCLIGGTNNLGQQQTVQKFGNQKTMVSDVGLGAHEGKYTPNSSVPDIATRWERTFFTLPHTWRDSNWNNSIQNIFLVPQGSPVFRYTTRQRRTLSIKIIAHNTNSSTFTSINRSLPLPIT